VNRLKSKLGSFLPYIPAACIVLFLILYLISAYLYPGGHHLNHDHVGFCWIHNYWCDLYTPLAYNGQINAAMYISIGATLMVLLGIAYFFYLFPNFIETSDKWSKVIRIAGVTAMLVALPVFTDAAHNICIISASVLGLIALIGIIISLIRNKLKFFLWSAGVCAILIAITNIMFYSKMCINLLPSIQKITFLFVLLWLFGLNLFMVSKR